MRVQVVSDVHGNAEALAALGGADALVCLGDLALFVDYDDPTRGILPDVFGADAARQVIALRNARRFTESRDLLARLWAGIDRDRVIEEKVRAQYDAIFAAMPRPAYVTYGNVDLPRLWPDYARDGITLLDGEVVELGGRTFGFVGGGLPSVYRTPYEVDEETFAAKVAALGRVDVLCSHIPPAVGELCYDTVARRFERGSDALLDAIRTTQPRLALFGHVHNPLTRRLRLGRTECVNVGHFDRRTRPFVLEW